MTEPGSMEDDGAWGMTPDAPRPQLDAFATRFAELLDQAPKTQRQIAMEMGYRHPNILSMFKTGATRVPLAKVSRFAFVLGGNERELVRLWLATYMPEIQPTLERCFDVSLTDTEHSWLAGLRQTFGTRVPAFDADAAALMHLLAKRRDLQPAPDPGPRGE